MINQANIGEWVREVQARPESAPLIIREIANRLIELDRLNEKLRAENLELSTGLKVRQYKDRIAELEYQLAIMSRQLEGQAISDLDIVNLLLYNQRGQVIKLELNTTELISGATLASFQSQLTFEPGKIRLLAVSPTEELLFMFDSGRTISLPVADLPAGDSKNLDWPAAYQTDLRSDQELIVIIPIGKMAAFDQGVQFSRLGYTRKILKNYLQKHIAQGNIGKGINQSNGVDIPLNLTLCNTDDIVVIVSKQGYLLGLLGQSLPIALDKAAKLDPDDYLVTSFVVGSGQSLVVVTQEGRAVRYPSSWLKPVSTIGGRGQPIWSKQKATSGIQVIGAAPAGDDGWGLGLRQDGALIAIKIGDIPLSQPTKIEHPLKNIYPFDLVAFTCITT